MSRTVYVYRGKVKHCCKYCGCTVRRSEYEELRSTYEKVFIDEEGYASKNDEICANCSVKVVKKAGKFGKKLLVFLLIVALIGGGLLLFKNVVFGTSRIYESAMGKKIEKYEKSDKLIKDYVLFGSGADYTFETLKKSLSSGDYKMKYYTSDGVAEVIKYTLGDRIIMSWSFNKGFGDLSGKTYILMDDVIYENGGKKIAYTPDSTDYNELTEKLNRYLPESCCCKGTYNSADEYDNPDEKVISHIIRGENDTVLYEVTGDKYYEKTADIFIYIEITDPSGGDSVKLPEKSDYASAE